MHLGEHVVEEARVRLGRRAHVAIYYKIANREFRMSNQLQGGMTSGLHRQRVGS